MDISAIMPRILSLLFDFVFLLFPKFDHGNDQGEEGEKIRDHCLPSSHRNVVGDPKKARGKGDPSQQPFVFHSVGDRGQKLGCQR